MEIQFSQQFF